MKGRLWNDELATRREYYARLATAVQTEGRACRRRGLALMSLAEAAGNEPDLLVRTWSDSAIWEGEQSVPRLRGEHPSPRRRVRDVDPSLRTRRSRRLPSWLTPLATEERSNAWQQLRAITSTDLRGGNGRWTDEPIQSASSPTTLSKTRAPPRACGWTSLDNVEMRRGGSPSRHESLLRRADRLGIPGLGKFSLAIHYGAC